MLGLRIDDTHAVTSSLRQHEIIVGVVQYVQGIRVGVGLLIELFEIQRLLY